MNKAISLAAATALILTPALSTAQQLPTGGSVAAGSATISSPNASTLNVNQSTNRAVINWSGFSVGAGGTVNFNQPGASSATLNRVTGSTPSSIAGRINAPGTVMLVNPNGIAITKNGVVNVGSFAASTLDINNDDFMSGNYKFTGNGASAGVTNAGRIIVADGGFAALLGGHVANDGIISARLGKVGLGSGELMTLDLSGDGFLSVAVPTLSGIVGADGKPLVSNKGKIRADGGVVYLSAATAAGLLRDAVHVPGSIRANSVGTRNGKIVIGGGAGGKVTVTGKVKANGNATANSTSKGGKIDISGAQVAVSGKVKANGASGGTIKVTGTEKADIAGEVAAKGASGKGGTVIVSADAINIGSAAKLDVSGAQGGLLLIGGDYQGGVNAANNFWIEPVETALTTVIAAGATLNAAGSNGEGGKIVVWSDDLTKFAGHLSVAGTNGKGGFAEVSGHRLLDFTGTANLAGTAVAGTLLLDPRNVVISLGADSGGSTASGTYTPSADDSILNVTTLLTALASGNVIVTTGDSGSQAGDITVADAIVWSSGNSLTLSAYRNVAVNAAITNTGGAAVTLRADSSGTGTGTVSFASTAIDVSTSGLVSIYYNPTGDSATVNTTKYTSGTQISYTDNVAGGATLKSYMLVNTVFDLQNMQNNMSGSYALGRDIDASTTASWNSGAGFDPIGKDATPFTGTLDGQYHIIDGLTINRPTTNKVGLFGYTSMATVSRLGLTNVNIVGQNYVGALAGQFDGVGTDLFATGRVQGQYQVGGLMGDISDLNAQPFVVSLTRAYTNVSVYGSGSEVGGLVGTSSANLTQVYASGAVTGTSIFIGGLVGYMQSGCGCSVINGYYDTLTTGKAGAGTGYVTTQMQSGLPTGFDSNWGIVTGRSYAYLTGFYNGTPQVISGSVYNSTGSTALAGEKVSALINGANAGSIYSGANGYFNILLPSGSIGANSQIATYTTGANAGVTYQQDASGSQSGMSITAGWLSQSSAAASMSAISAGMAVAIGSSGVSTALANRWLVATNSSFTLDEALTHSGTVRISAGGTVTQNAGASISANALRLSLILGGASFTLLDTGNSIATLGTSALGTGSLNLYNSTALSVTSVTANGGLVIRTAGALTLSNIVSSSASGDAVVLSAGGTFTNTWGSSAISTPNGRWIVYAGTPVGSSFNNLNSNNDAVWNATYANNAPSTIASGNRYVFALQPTLTFTSTNASKYYGQTADVSSNYTVSSNVSAVTNAYTVASLESLYSGTPTLSSAGTATTATVVGGPYTIDIAQGSLASTGAAALNFVSSGLLTVNKASLIIYVGSANKTYGTTYSSTTNFTTSGLLNSDTVTSADLASAGAAATADVGNYALTASNAVGTGLSNYNVLYSAGTLQVGQAILNISASNATKVYGSTLSFAGTEFTVSGLVNGDTVSGVSLTSTGAAATANVGGYQINVSNATGAKISNYLIFYNNGSLSVTPASLTITSNNQSKVYGTTANLGTTDFTVTGSLFNSDTLTGVTLSSGAAAASAAVGSQAIIPSNATGTGLSNYNITYSASGRLTVTPAPLTITANDQSKTYGQILGSNGAYSITNGALVNGDTLTGVTLASAGFAGSASVAGGPYAITASNAQGTGLYNYTITYVAGALTVAKANLTVTADNQSKFYGDTLNLGTTGYTTSSLFNGDTVTGVTLSSAGAAATGSAGTHAIVASDAQGNGLANYNITYVNGSLNVSKATLIVYVGTASKIYGDTPTVTNQYSVSGLKNSDGVTSVDLTSAGAAVTAAVGNYALNGSNAQGTGLGNYNISYQPGTLYVSPATLTLTASNLSKVYGTTHAFAGTEFLASGLVNGDTVSSVALSSTGAAAGANVGGYQIVASNASGSGLSNYIIYYNNGSMSVTPAPLTITAGNQSKTYGTAHNLGTSAYTVSGLVNGNTVTGVTLTSGAAAATANVGFQAINASNATGTGLSNYTVSYVAGTLTVNPAPLTVTIDNRTKTYGQVLSLGTTGYTVSGDFYNGDTLTGVTLTSAGAAGTAQVSGSPYAITGSNATGAGIYNYAIIYVDGGLTVTPANITVTANNQSKIYGATPDLGSTAYTVTGNMFNGDSVTAVTLTSAGAAATATVDGGPYAITPSSAQGTGLGNYNITYADGSLTVNKASLIIYAGSMNKTYGSTYTFGNEYTTLGLKNADTVSAVDLASAGTAATANVGNYAVTGSNAQGADLSNYNVFYQPGSMNVSPAILTVNGTTSSKVYGSTHTFSGTEFTSSGLVNGDMIDAVTIASAGVAGTANVGSYAATVSNATGTGLGNYVIFYNQGTLSVTPAPLTVTATNQSKVYGSTASLGTTDFTTSGTLYNGDVVSGVTLTSPGGAPATANVGGYSLFAASATGTGLSNYSITYVAGTLQVTPAPLTVTADNRSKTYGDVLSLGTTGFTTTGALYNGDTITGVSLASGGASATASVSGGPYAIVASNAQGSGASNYAITYVSGSLTVNRASLTVTANDASKGYGQTLTFNGSEFTSTGLKNGETIGAVTLTSAGAAAGADVGSSPYAIVASAATGGTFSANNYNINYVNGALTVTPAALTLTITPDAASKVYGDALSFSGTEYSQVGLVNGDTISGVTLTSAGAVTTAAVGQYDIASSNAVFSSGSALNYNIVYNVLPGGLTVTARALIVTANSASRVYGDANPATGTAIGDNLVNGDTIAGVTLNTPATAASGVGSYNLTGSAATGTGLSNYAITYVTVANGLTVTPRALIVTASAVSRVYGDANPATGAATGDNLVNGDTITGVNLTSPATTTSGVGTYSLTGSNATGTGLGNYTITYAAVSNGLTVTPRALVVTANGVSRVYGDANPATGTATGDNLVNGDTITGITLNTPATTGSGVGSYALTGSAATGTGLGNYAITYATVANGLTITPRALVITANNVSRIYGDANPTTGTATGNNLVNGDTITGVTLNTPATAVSGVGSYALTGSAATGTGLDNYTITYATVANGLTVTPRALVISANAVSRVYGDANPAAGTAAGDNLVNGDTITGVTLNSPAIAVSSVGSYALTGSAATGTGLGNYAITYATVANGLTVTPRVLIVTANSVSRVYGDANPATGTATGDNLVNGDTVTGVTLNTPATAASGVGNYNLTGSNATGTGLGNYTITYATIANGLTVTPRALVVTANNVSRIYGNANPATGTATGDNLVNGDSITGVNLTSPATTASGVGSYALTGSAATGMGLGNYTITYAMVANGLTVTPRALMITANSVSRVYGDANPPTGTATGDNLVDGDTIVSVSLTSPATAASGVGSYALTGSSATGTGLGNYTITYATVTNGLTVTPRALIVTASSVSRVYGDANPTSGTATGDNLVNGDSITGVTLNTPATAASGVGGYNLTGSNATGTGLGNYAITYATVANGLTVTPRSLVITANNVSRVYGDANPASGTATGDNLVNGDTITGVSLTSPATGASNVGSYSLAGSAATGTGLGNYTITYATATNGLTVTPRALTVTADAKSKLVGEADPLLSYRITSGSLVNADTLTGVLTRNAGESEGVYAILQGSLAASSNYSLAYVGANLTIAVPPPAPTPANNGDYATSRYIAPPGGSGAPIVNISFRPNAPGAPVISVVSAPRVVANPPANTNVVSLPQDPAQNIAPAGGSLDLFVPISQFDKAQYVADTLPGFAPEASQAAVLTMIARAGLNNRAEPKIDTLWGNAGASWPDAKGTIGKTAQFGDGNGTSRQPAGDNGFAFVNGTTDMAALLRRGPVMLGGVKNGSAATPWLLALQMTADGKGIIANDPTTGRQVVLAYDPTTRTVGTITGLVDPATRQIAPLGETAPASVTVPPEAWSALSTFQPATYFAVTL